MDVYLHPQPEQSEIRQQLEAAERLYQSGSSDIAEKRVRALMRRTPTAEPEGRFLLGRIAYSRGTPWIALREFRFVAFTYPRSAPVRSGRLAAKAARAAELRLEAMDWSCAGAYMGLLEALDPQAFAALVEAEEKKVRSAVAAFNAAAAGRTFPVRNRLEQWMRDAARTPDRFIGVCDASNTRCARDTRRYAEARCQEKNREEPGRWAKEYRNKLESLRKAFAVSLEKQTGAALAPHLATEADILNAIEPREVPIPPSPCVFVVREHSSRRKGDLIHPDVAKDSWTIFCERKNAFGQTPDQFRFTGLDAENVLLSLGKRLDLDRWSQHARRNTF